MTVPRLFLSLLAFLLPALLTAAPPASAPASLAPTPTGTGLAPFVMAWDESLPGPSNLASTIPAPAGREGFVQVRAGHLYAGSDRLRLFGVNVTAAACFPDHDTARKVAARLARFGVNAVRFHFLDSTWGEPRLIRYETGDWNNWNAEALDRLDYFIAALKEQGIYANINLLVGRQFGLSDGVDPSIGTMDWKAAHAVGFFHAPHLEAQKAYARRLLGHLNPYTGLRYLDDPAVAMVEINNENGLLHTWFGGEFDTLPPVFARDLQAQWNRWLSERHKGRATLEKAWGVRQEAQGPELLKSLDAWTLEQHQGARADRGLDKGVARIQVRATGSEGWHIQLNQPGLAVKKGGIYTVSLSAWADRERRVDLSLMQAHEPWAGLGFSAPLDLGTTPSTWTFTFQAEADDANARLNIGSLNQDGAVFHFSKVSLRPGGRLGPPASQSLEARNMALPRASEAAALLPAQRLDWIRFLHETEARYWTAMSRFLKEELGLKVPVAGTIVATSTPHLMASLDIVDSHAYWEHPQFPGMPWDSKNWFIYNISMVDHPDKATLTSLAFQRVRGKPHMVSEYNHPAPNIHAAEGPVFLSAFGARQDWDALFLYTWSHGESQTKAGRIPDFFDLGQHPVVLANLPFASLLFRRADLAPAPTERSIPFDAATELGRIAEGGHAWNIIGSGPPRDDFAAAITRRIALDLGQGGAALPSSGDPRGSAEAGPARSAAEQRPAADRPARTPADPGLTWDLPAQGQGTFTVKSPRSKAVLGHLDGRSIDLGNGVNISVGTTMNGWACVTLTLLEGEAFDRKPKRALLALTARAENTAMGWTDTSLRSVGANWGRSPSLVEVVSATITLPAGTKAPTLRPLDQNGQPGQAIAPATHAGGSTEFTLGSGARTLWYEVVWP